MQTKPLLSVIIPVYNADKFLRECVDSIIHQDIGFEDNIELVLVNDGSKDGSDAICKEYQAMFPNNVVYHVQENAGASHARNTGLGLANGEYLSFVDADDYMSKNAARSVMDFFKTAPDVVDIATIRVIQFGSKNKERPINKKFKDGTRVADLNQPEWYDICPRIAPSFIRSSVAKEHKFREDTRFYEDTLYFTEVVMRTRKMGIVADGIYYNRKHEDTDTTASITTGATSEKRFYLDSPEKVALPLLEKYKDENGQASLYIQYLVQYEMRWRMLYNPNKPQDVLSASEYKQYQSVNEKILQLLTNEAIVDFKANNVWQRVYLLNLKNKRNVLDEASINEENRLVWQGHILFNYEKKLQSRLTSFAIQDNELTLTGYFAEFMSDAVHVYPRLNGEKYDKIELTLTPESVSVTEMALEYPMRSRTAFTMRIPLKRHEVQTIDFACSINGRDFPVRRMVNATMFEPGAPRQRYSKADGYLLAWRYESVSIAPDTLVNRIRFDIDRVVRFARKLYENKRSN